MYFNNSIFGRVGVGCSVGLLLPVMDFIGMLHPLGVPFLPRPIWGFATGQGMVFYPSVLNINFLRGSVLNRVIIFCESVLVTKRIKFVCTPSKQNQ